MKRRTPLRYVHIQANPRSARNCTAQPKTIDVAALAKAIVRALRSARRSASLKPLG